MARKCLGSTPDGSQCDGFAMTGGDFCFFHDPRYEARRKAASSAGGHAGKPATHLKVPFLCLRTASDICNLYEILTGSLYKGEVEHRTANCVAQLGNILRRALELDAKESEIKELESLGGLEAPLGGDSEPGADSDRKPATESDGEPMSDSNGEPDSSRIPLRTIAEIIVLLENAINLVLQGEMHPPTANSLGCIANNRLPFIAMELEERMARLEAAEEEG